MPLEAMSVAYGRQLEHLSNETRRRLLRIWDTLAPWGDAEIDRFHAIAKPLVEAAAKAASDVATQYVVAVVGDTARTPSALIPADAAARLYDPADRIGSLMAGGAPFEEATKAARQVVDDLGHDAVHSSARQAFADAAPPAGRYQRAVSGQTCQWCLSLAGAIFPTAAAATFGHAHCDCRADFASAVGASNQRIIDAAGGDVAVRKYKQANSLRRSSRTAKKHQEQARLDQLTETDPARRERLSIREQEWETRAERADERLALLTAH